MNIDQFLESRIIRHSYINHPGFKELYVRKGKIYFNGRSYDQTLTIARVVAVKKNQGTFTNFVSYIRYNYDISIMIECVLTKRFAKFLEKQGYLSEKTSQSFLLPTKRLIVSSPLTLIPIINKVNNDCSR